MQQSKQHSSSGIPPCCPSCEPWLAIPRTAAARFSRRHWLHEMSCCRYWPVRHVRLPDHVRRIPISTRWLMTRKARCMGSVQLRGPIRCYMQGWIACLVWQRIMHRDHPGAHRGEKGFGCVLARIACLCRATPDVHHQGIDLICSSAHISVIKCSPLQLDTSVDRDKGLHLRHTWPR